MSETDALVAIAEISIAFAGFSGIVAALRARGDDWHAWDVWRTAALLIISLGTVVFCFLPLALHYFGVTPPALWRISSGVVAAYAVGNVVSTYHTRPSDFTEAPFHRQVGPAIYGLAALNVIAQVLNALGPGSFALYFLGLLLAVVMAAIQFTAIVLIRPPS